LQDIQAPPFPVQTARELIGTTIELFMRHLSVFAWVAIAPALALSVLNMALGSQDLTARAVLYVPILFAELLIWSASTLVAAGAVLGHVPDTATAYRCALRSPIASLLLSTMLMGLLVLVGTILLVIPGIIALAQTFLMPAIVVIERRKTWDSLRRSRALGAGFYARNLFVITVLFLPALVATMMIVALEIEHAMASVILALLTAVLQAVSMLGTVLVYIDMRARKEQLDPTTFALEINAAYGEATSS
jgi:hypothetical protein